LKVAGKDDGDEGEGDEGEETDEKKGNIPFQLRKKSFCAWQKNVGASLPLSSTTTPSAPHIGDGVCGQSAGQTSSSALPL